MPSEIERLLVLHELGEGGMATVQLCHDPLLDRRVALKRLKLPEDPAQAERYLIRFRREGRTLAGLRHAGIPAVHDIGEDAQGPYMIMEFVEGQGLGELVRREGGLEQRRAARVVEQLARTLAYVHEQGVLHRDLKGDNVIIDSRDRPFLLDFGLCKAPERDREACTAPVSGLGSLSHMPPEQANNAVGATTLSDVFGVGAVLFEALTGRAPFVGTSVRELIGKILATPPEPPSTLKAGIDPSLDAICARAMQAKPEERYPSAQALADDLRAFLEGRSLEARRAPPLQNPELPGVLDQLMDEELEEKKRGPSASQLKNIGDVHLEKREYPAAVEAYERAYASQPDDEELGLRLAFALHRAGDRLGAIAIYSQLLKKHPQLTRALMGRGSARLEMKNFRGAYEDLRDALERLGPNHPRAQRLRVAMRHASGRLGGIPGKDL